MLSACSGQSSNQNNSGTDASSVSQSSTDPLSSVSSQNSDSVQADTTVHTALNNKNNSVVIEDNGKKYYFCFGFIYRLIDDKNVALISDSTGSSERKLNVNDPTLEQAFRDAYNNYTLNENSFFCSDLNKIVRYDLEEDTISKMSVLFTQEQYTEFISKENGGNPHYTFVTQRCVADMHSCDDGFIYFISTGNTGESATTAWGNATNRICRFDPDGKKLEFFGTERAVSIDTKDDRIYFIDNGLYNDNGSPALDKNKTGIYSIRTDGTDKKLLCSLTAEFDINNPEKDGPRDLRIIDNFIYFITGSNILSRIPLNGGNAEFIINCKNDDAKSYCVDPGNSTAYDFLNSTLFKASFGSNSSDQISDSKLLLIEESASKGFADIIGDYLYFNCDGVNNTFISNRNFKLVLTDDFTADAEGMNSLCRPLPSLRYDLKNNRFERIYEIIDFRTKEEAEEFTETNDYNSMVGFHFEWRQEDNA